MHQVAKIAGLAFALMGGCLPACESRGKTIGKYQKSTKEYEYE
jgi:hypothetical protein